MLVDRLLGFLLLQRAAWGLPETGCIHVHLISANARQPGTSRSRIYEFPQRSAASRVRRLAT